MYKQFKVYARPRITIYSGAVILGYNGLGSEHGVVQQACVRCVQLRPVTTERTERRTLHSLHLAPHWHGNIVLLTTNQYQHDTERAEMSTMSSCQVKSNCLLPGHSEPRGIGK